MANFKILFRRSATKELQKLPKTSLKLIIKRIEQLSEEPRPVGCEKLSGNNYYRIRQGKYRIVYSIQDQELIVLVIKIGHRKDIYQRI